MSARSMSQQLRGVRWSDPSGTALVRPDGNNVSLRSGVRTVLIGDSMTDWYNDGGVTWASAFYDSATGVLSVTSSGAHAYYNGMMAAIWHYSYTSMRDQVYVPVTVTGATTFTVTLAAGLAAVPATDIKTGLFVRPDKNRALASFVNWFQMATGWPLNVVRNAAQSGSVVAGNVRRLARDVAAYSPDLVIGQAPGINDLRSADNRTEDEIESDLTSLFDGILATGAVLVIGTITPVSSTETDRAYQGNMQTVRRVNDWIRRYAASQPAMIVLDHYRHFVDISSTSGLALSTRVRADGIHPATKSAILLAKQLITALTGRVQQQDSSLPKSIIDCHANSRLTVSSASASGGVVTVNSTAHKYKVGEEFRALNGSVALANGWFTVASVPGSGSFTYSAPGIADGAITGLLISRSRNLFTNPLLQTTSGGNVNTAGTNTITGTAAGNIVVQNATGSGCTAVASVAAAVNVASTALGGWTLAAPLGNEQLLAISAASTDNAPQIGTYGSTAFGTQLLAGRSYVCEAVLRLSSTDWAATWLKNLYCNLSMLVDGIWLGTVATSSQDTTETQTIAEDMRLHIRTPVIRIPAGASSISNADMIFRATIGATFSGGPVLTMGVSQIQVVDVTGQESLYL